MRASVRTWGNSLALRLPKSPADDLGIKDGDEVTVAADNGRVVLTPVARRYGLDALLKAITTAGNRHRETNTGSLIGREVW